MKFRYAGIIRNSMVNGDGIRDVIFFSGCSRDCPGCHNKEMQAFDFGEDKEIDEIVDLVKQNKELIDGVTISGGDPIFQYDALLELCKKLKQEGFNVWLYTGAYYSQLRMQDLELFKYIDAIVDGPYMKNFSHNPPKYRGSHNQSIIYFKDGKISHSK